MTPVKLQGIKKLLRFSAVTSSTTTASSFELIIPGSVGKEGPVKQFCHSDMHCSVAVRCDSVGESFGQTFQCWI